MKKLLIVPCTLFVILNLSLSQRPPETHWNGARADTLRGSDAGEILRGTDENDFIDAGEGDDQLWGEAGDDHLKGGGGDDLLFGGSESDVMEGGDGNDQMMGGTGQDWMFGEAGDDNLQGGDGDDVLDGGSGVDFLFGNSGDDTLDGGADDDTISGGEGNDIIDGGDGSDVLLGGSGNDDMDGGDGDDILQGGEGDDTLDGADGNDELSGGPGNDAIFGRDGQDVLKGGFGDDVLSGGDGDDILVGGVGNDLLSGGFDDDILLGGANADTLLAGPGDDVLYGGDDSDLLIGDVGDDILKGEAGNDELRGGEGTDTILAGSGDDFIFLRRGDVDALRVESIDGGLGADTLVLNGFYSVMSIPMISIASADTSGNSDIQGAEFWITDPLTEGRYKVTRVEHILYFSIYPFSVLPTSSPSILRLTNPSTGEMVTGWIEFFGENGDSTIVSVNDAAAAFKVAFEISPLARIDLMISGTAPFTAHVYSNAPVLGVGMGLESELGNFGITENKLSGGLVFPIVIDRERELDTAFTILNGGPDTALKLTLKTKESGEVDTKEIDLPSNGLVSGFVGDFLRTTSVIDGTLEVSGGTISGTVFLTGAGKDNLISLPAIPAGLPVFGDKLHFPHITAGKEAETSIILINPADPTARGTLEFLDEYGESLELEIKDHGRVSSIPFEIRGGRSAIFLTSDIGVQVTATARATFDEGYVSGLVTFSVPGAGSGAFRLGIPLQRFIAPVTRSNSMEISTRVILQNSGVANSVTLILRDEDGNPVPSGETTLKIPANGFISLTTGELFPRAETSEFEGTLTVEASESNIISSILRIDSIRKEVLNIPVAPLN